MEYATIVAFGKCIPGCENILGGVMQLKVAFHVYLLRNFL